MNKLCNDKEKQGMFSEIGVKTFYISKSLDDLLRTTVIFKDQKMFLFDIFMNAETKPIVEASGNIFYEDARITGWISKKN